MSLIEHEIKLVRQITNHILENINEYYKLGMINDEQLTKLTEFEEEKFRVYNERQRAYMESTL